MLIGVLSDTHLRTGRTLPQFVWKALEDADLILHAGDILVDTLLTDLAAVAPVYAVRGNCDSWEIDLPNNRIVTCEEVQIGLTHGYEGFGRSTPERAFNSFRNSSVDIIVFGHSHQPHLEWKDGILLFNPGSPTDKRRELQYSMGFLRISGKQIEAEHLYF